MFDPLDLLLAPSDPSADWSASVCTPTMSTPLKWPQLPLILPSAPGRDAQEALPAGLIHDIAVFRVFALRPGSLVCQGCQRPGCAAARPHPSLIWLFDAFH